MATPETVATIKDLAADIIADPIESLVRNPSWGTIDFDRAIPDLERVRHLVAPLTVMPLELLPENIAAQFAPALEPLRNIIERIRNFNLDVANPGSTRDNICANLPNHIDNAYPVITPHIPFLLYTRGDAKRNIDDLVRKVAEAGEILDAAQTDFTAKRGEVDAIVEATRQASAKAGVAHFTMDFSDAADQHKASSSWWLAATGILALLTAIVALFSLFIDLPHDATVPLVINRLSSKLVLLGILLAATVWCGRLFKAAKHQESVNRHRANALKTFQAFVQAADPDSPIRDAILMETTRSIFTITPSGYLDTGDTSIEGGTKVVEVVKNLTQAVGSKS